MRGAYADDWIAMGDDFDELGLFNFDLVGGCEFQF
jgi:hypothetical protein